MEISQYVKQRGTFLKAEDVMKNPAAPFIVLTEGQIVKSEKFDNERLHVEGEHNGEEKVFDMSKTNARFVAQKLGEDTKKWIGKQLILETYKTKTSDGKMVNALNVKEVR